MTAPRVELHGREAYVLGYVLVRSRFHERYSPCGNHCDGLSHWRIENADGERAGNAEFCMIPQRDLDAIAAEEAAERAEAGKPIHDTDDGRGRA